MAHPAGSHNGLVQGLRGIPNEVRFLKRAGLVDDWKARGWPDLCHPVGAGDFACE